MAEQLETIEAFVAKLQTDGVEAGRSAAERIKTEAEQEAQRLIAAAQAEAAQIVSKAENQAGETLQRSRSELDLAVRDTLLRLREFVNRSLRQLLNAGAAEALANADLLKALIGEVVQQYAQADIAGDKKFNVRVTEKQLEDLTKWAAADLRKALLKEKADVQVEAGLRQEGFEIAVQSGTVEVTEESIAAVLADLVSPRLGELIVTSGKQNGAKI